MYALSGFPSQLLVVIALILAQIGTADAGPLAQRSAEPCVTISTEFPGGNVSVVSNDGASVQLAPDLRGGRDWFYWCFEATAVNQGHVTFTFPEKVAKFKRGAVGFQGPAISRDDGKTWKWRGSNDKYTSARSFTWMFESSGETARFAVTIPYTESNFQAFAKRHTTNPHFQQSLLTKTRAGRNVELVQIGTPGEGRKAVLMTCRHHACETIASFLLEGIMTTAMSDTPEGRRFRESFVLYAVPFVDKDGVESGDQGKNRFPHDHNRDYGEDTIYRSVQAIKTLGVEKDIRALMDLHCPTLVMDIHQRFYFAGPNDIPTHNAATVKQLASLIKAELPEGAPYGPALQLSPTVGDRHKHCSGFFAKLNGIMMSTTLETPFAPRKTNMSPDDVRSYGAAVLRAWNEVRFEDPRIRE